MLNGYSDGLEMHLSGTFGTANVELAEPFQEKVTELQVMFR